MKKIFLLSTLYFLFSTFLTGCATVPKGFSAQFKETVMINGTRYVTAEAIAELYNADYHWDPITKKAVFTKDDKVAKMMVDSNLVLLDNKVQLIDKNIEFYHGTPVIPYTFTYRALAPFFKEEYIESIVPTARISGLPIRNVIIDPGHGGKDPGAVGRSGLREKDVALDIAKRLKSILKTQGVNVTLTRESDEFVSLGQRAAVANRENADFFISIHTNASRSRWISGVEVFYLSEAIDESQRSLSAAENYNLNLRENYSGKNTAAILWDLIYKENRRSSIDLAELICYSLSRDLAQRNRGNKPAQFYVLKGTNIPAVLIEVGFISNRKEEERLRERSYREKIAQAIAAGLTQYNQRFARRR